ncbi:hypothetical protein Tco_0548196 [Tanacetum coccineum]
MTNIDSLKPRLSFFEADPKTNTIVTTPVNVTGAPVTNTVANHAEKPEKFNGQNFKRWQQKMFFYLGTLNLAWFLNETAPQAVQDVEAWKHSDFLCHNYVLIWSLDYLFQCNLENGEIEFGQLSLLISGEKEM